MVELEKLKVMMDTFREAKQATDETIRTISESLGELRSMVFQTDASLKEVSIKMEKIEDEIKEINPQQISKKFREFNENLEKHQLTLEKLEKKSEDLAEKINKVYETLKAMGNIENLLSLIKDVQKRVDEVNEATKYIERVGAKTEKIFIDLSKSLDEFVVYKSKQDEMDESIKELTKALDGLNTKLEGYVSKKDLDDLREEIIQINKRLEEIDKVLPLLQARLPESIMQLKRERENILLFLESLAEQFREKRISKEEYENIKRANEKKLEEIENKLKEEWKKLEEIVKEKGAGERIELKETQKEEGKMEEVPKEEKVEAEKVEPEEIKAKEEEKVEEKPKEKPKKEKVRKGIAKEKIKKKVKKGRKKKVGEEEKMERKKKLLSELKKLKV